MAEMNQGVSQSALERRVSELSTLNAIGEILNEEVDFAGALGRALGRLVALLGLKSGWVFLTRVSQGDLHEGSFRAAATTGLPPALARDNNEPICKGTCDCQWLFRRGNLDRGVNIVHCSRLEAATGDKAGLEIHASIPLLGQRGPVGIMNLAAPGRERFDDDTLLFLTAVGRQLGVAFERSILQDERTREARYLATLEERQRLAAEMHDSVTQHLFAADLSLRVARDNPDGVQRAASLKRGAELVTAALGELRALVEVTRPPDASDLGTLLKRLAGRVPEGMRVHLEAEPLPLSPQQTEALYRVAQEAVHNALKHAGAQHLWIGLEQRGPDVVLSVADDGRGLSGEERGGKTGGFGFETMRARAASLGGVLKLSNRPRGGLGVEVTFPWRR